MLSSFIIRRLIPVKPPPVFRRDSLSGADGMQMNRGEGVTTTKDFSIKEIYTLKINRIYIYIFLSLTSFSFSRFDTITFPRTNNNNYRQTLEEIKD